MLNNDFIELRVAAEDVVRRAFEDLWCLYYFGYLIKRYSNDISETINENRISIQWRPKKISFGTHNLAIFE